MNYYGGFGLLFGLMALLIWFTYYEKGKEKENEKALIDQEGPLGVWVIPGENKIGYNILNQHC